MTGPERKRHLPRVPQRARALTGLCWLQELLALALAFFHLCMPRPRREQRDGGVSAVPLPEDPSSQRGPKVQPLLISLPLFPGNLRLLTRPYPAQTFTYYWVRESIAFFLRETSSSNMRKTEPSRGSCSREKEREKDLKKKKDYLFRERAH